ncbi:hypothetical protein OXE08_004527 [Salmonella enterica]|nr:hypothetical protein [Salmonella enterica]
MNNITPESYQRYKMQHRRLMQVLGGYSRHIGTSKNWSFVNDMSLLHDDDDVVKLSLIEDDSGQESLAIRPVNDPEKHHVFTAPYDEVIRELSNPESQLARDYITRVREITH